MKNMDPLTFNSSIVIKSTSAIAASRTSGALVVSGGLQANGPAQFAKGITVGAAYTGTIAQTNDGVFFTSRGTYTDTNSGGYQNLFFNALQAPVVTSGNVTAESATMMIQGAPQATGSATVGSAYALLVASGTSVFRDTTNSLSKTSGAVVVSGGLGVTGDLTTSNVVSDSMSTGAFRTGTLTVSGSATMATVDATALTASQATLLNANIHTLTGTNVTFLNATGAGLVITGTTVSTALIATNATLLNATIDSLNVGTVNVTGASATALTVSGGVTILSTANALSSTNGGALTVSGGIGANSFAIGQSLSLNTTSVTQNALRIGYNAGNAQITLNHSSSGTSTIFNNTAGNLVLQNPGRAVELISLASTAGLTLRNTDTSQLSSVLLRLATLGAYDTDSNYEFLDIKNSGTSSFLIQSQAAGSGVLRPLIFNSSQLVLETNGQIAATNGSLISRGIAINSTSSSTDQLRLGYNSGLNQLVFENSAKSTVAALLINSGGHMIVQNVSGPLRLVASGGVVVEQAGLLRVAALGALSTDTNTQFLDIIGNGTQNIIQSTASGSGLLQPIAFNVGSQTNQLLLQTSGAIVMGNASLTSTSDQSGTLQVAGSVTVRGTENALSVTSGAMVVSGGLGVAKQLRIGERLFVNGVDVTPSDGSIPETSFSLSQNVTEFTDIPGFAFNNSTVRGAIIHASVAVTATANLFQVYTIRIVQRQSDWLMTVDAAGDASLVVFSVTSAGQVQYKSGSYPGFVSATLKYKANTLTV